MKTLVKTVSYKTVATVELALLAWFLTGSFELAGKVGLAHLTLSTVTYAAFEHAFARVWEVFVD